MCLSSKITTAASLQFLNSVCKDGLVFKALHVTSVYRRAVWSKTLSMRGVIHILSSSESPQIKTFMAEFNNSSHFETDLKNKQRY